MIRIALSLIALCCLAVPAHGGHCGAFRQQVYGYHAKAIAVYPLYQVGSGLREEAIAKRAAAEAIKANDALWQQKFNQLRQEFFKFQGQGTFTFGGEGAAGTTGGTGGNADTPAGSVYPDGAAALITQKCASCHSGETPKGGLDLTVNIDRATAAEIFVRTFSDDPSIRMPPDGSLTDDQRQVFFELSESVLKGAKP